jgi:adenylate kinase family enzyme
MKKAIVIGCPGSGKTTFAEKLRDKTGLPLYYLDAIWHKPDRTHISREDFDERIKEIFAEDEWIIDGNYSRTIEMRLEACDTVFLFDLPTEVCLQGAIDRLGKERYDVPWVDRELDTKFREEIERFANNKLPEIYNLLEKHGQNKNIVVFKTREEADNYIDAD